MEALLKFYKDILEMLNLTVAEDGQVSLVIDGVINPLLIDGLPTYLPTKNNIDTLYEIVDGKSVKVKELFNPLDENSIKGGNKSFIKLKNIMELNFLGMFYHTAEAMLLRVANSTDEDDMNVIKFISILAGKKAGAKVMVNNNTLIKWDKIYRSIRLKYIDKKYIKLLVTKGGTIDDIKYNRVGVITFPLGEEILKVDNKNNSILEVKLLNKDINVFKSIFEYLVGDIDTINNGIQIGSLNKIAPSTHALLLMYDRLYKMFKPTINTILKSENDQETIDRLSLKELPLDIANISSKIDSFEQYVRMIPNTRQIDNVVEVNKNINPLHKQPVVNDGKKDFWSRNKGSQHQQVIQQPVYNQQQSLLNQQPVVMQQPVYNQQQSLINQQPVVMQQPVYNQQQSLYNNRSTYNQQQSLYNNRSTYNQQQPLVNKQDVVIPPIMTSNMSSSRVPAYMNTQHNNGNNNLPILNNSYTPPQQNNSSGSVWDRLRTNTYRH